MTWWQIALLIIGYITVGITIDLVVNIIAHEEIEGAELPLMAFFWPIIVVVAIIWTLFSKDMWNEPIRWFHRRLEEREARSVPKRKMEPTPEPVKKKPGKIIQHNLEL